MTAKRAIRKSPAPSPAISWELIRTFLALERYGEYSLAAEMEGLDDSTLRRRIQTLEQHVGRAIFIRTEKGWQVSPDLQNLIKAARDMENAAEQFARSNLEEEGVIRISLMDAFAHRFAHVFGKFQDDYPGLTLNLTTETHFVDLQHEQVDIAIRLARPIQANSAVHITKIGDVPINAYASAQYLRRCPDPDFHRLLGMDVGFCHGDHTFTYGALDCKEFGLDGRVVAWFDSFSLLAHMCKIGLGVAILPTVMALEYPELEKVDPSHADVATELWMVSRFNLRAVWQQELAAMLRQELLCWQSA